MIVRKFVNAFEQLENGERGSRFIVNTDLIRKIYPIGTVTDSLQLVRVRYSDGTSEQFFMVYDQFNNLEYTGNA